MKAPSFWAAGSPIWWGSIGDTFGNWWAAHQACYSRVFLIADANAHRHWRQVLPLPPQTPAYILPVPEAEGAPGSAELLKNLQTCRAIWQAMLDATLDRRALVLTFGGGVVGDMGGFCAATYKRGVEFVHLPTTVLAMVDAVIGGKLGIDFAGVKNAVGLFRQPAAVFADVQFLHTLPEREWRSGLAEVVKHAYIADPALRQQLLQHPNLLLRPLSAAPSDWVDILQRAAAVKARIVDEDPQETGLRALLNFGHTFGHALEAYFLKAGSPIAHGEAVAVGLLCELEAPTADDLRLIAPLLPQQPLSADLWPHLWALMQHDKKNTSGNVAIATPGAEPFTLRRIFLSEAEARARWMRCLHLMQAAQ